MARSLNTKVNKMKLRPAAPTRSNMLTFMTHESHAGRHTRVTTSMAAGIHMWMKQNPVIIAPSTSLPPTLHQNPSHSNYQQEHGEKRLALAETPKKNNPSQHQHQQPHPPYLNGLPPPEEENPFPSSFYREPAGSWQLHAADVGILAPLLFHTYTKMLASAQPGHRQE